MATGPGADRWGGTLDLEPGYRVVVQLLPGGRAKVYWIDVTPWGAHDAGSFEGTTEQVWRAVERGPRQKERGGGSPV